MQINFMFQDGRFNIENDLKRRKNALKLKNNRTICNFFSLKIKSQVSQKEARN